MNSSG